MARYNKKRARDRRAEVISARVRGEVYDEIQKLAKREDLRMGDIVRRAVRNYLLKNGRAAS